MMETIKTFRHSRDWVTRVSWTEFTNWGLIGNFAVLLDQMQDRMAAIPRSYRNGAEFIISKSDRGVEIEIHYDRPATGEERRVAELVEIEREARAREVELAALAALKAKYDGQGTGG